MSDVSVADAIGGTVGMETSLAGVSAAKALTYMLPKAQLYVPKASSLGEMNIAAAATSLTGKNDNLALRALTKTKKIAAKSAVASTGLKGKLKQAAGVTPVFGLMTSSVMQGAAISATMAASNFYVMEVMYNPKSISFSCTGGGEVRGSQNGDAGVSQLTVASRISRIRMSAELVFEAINNSDAFHMDGLEFNLEAIANMGMGKIMQLTGNGYSVKKQCDGLLALLNFKRLKQVIFLWSNMFFHGELTNVDVRYEMFNKYGNPILARVRIQIEQNDSEKAIRYISDEQQWEDAIDLAFQDRLLG